MCIEPPLTRRLFFLLIFRLARGEKSFPERPYNPAELLIRTRAVIRYSAQLFQTIDFLLAPGIVLRALLFSLLFNHYELVSIVRPLLCSFFSNAFGAVRKIEILFSCRGNRLILGAAHSAITAGFYALLDSCW